MDLRHTAHGRHRRRIGRRPVLLIGIGVVVLVGLSVTAVRWVGRGDDTDAAGQARPSAVGGSHGSRAAGAATTAAPAPAASTATPAAGPPVAVGTKPHFVA